MLKDTDARVWNTGRKHSSAGQRIAAKVLPDGRIAFKDFDRHVDGITKSVYKAEEHGSIEKLTIDDYDRGSYDEGLQGELRHVRDELEQAVLDYNVRIQKHKIEEIKGRIDHGCSGPNTPLVLACRAIELGTGGKYDYDIAEIAEALLEAMADY